MHYLHLDFTHEFLRLAILYDSSIADGADSIKLLYGKVKFGKLVRMASATLLGIRMP
jgi:hypothetical protein